jgi:hypothetical protein
VSPHREVFYVELRMRTRSEPWLGSASPDLRSGSAVRTVAHVSAYGATSEAHCAVGDCRTTCPFVPGGCWFFTANLLDRRSGLVTQEIEALREGGATQTRAAST